MTKSTSKFVNFGSKEIKDVEIMILEKKKLKIMGPLTFYH